MSYSAETASLKIQGIVYFLYDAPGEYISGNNYIIL